MDGPQAAWQGLLKAAGAAGGLTVLVYLVGAVTTWVRLKAAGYPPDVGVAHLERAQALALGLRGLLVVVVLVGLLIVATGIVVATTRRVVKPLPATALAAAGLVASAFVGWRLFGLAFASSVTAWAGARSIVDRSWRSPVVRLETVVAVSLAAALAAVAWQVEGTVRIQAVFLTPPPRPFLAGVGIPSFGESSRYVYLDDVRSVAPDGRGGWRLNVHGERPMIAEVRRASVTLSYDSESAVLYHHVDSPARVLWHALRRVFR